MVGDDVARHMILKAGPTVKIYIIMLELFKDKLLFFFFLNMDLTNFSLTLTFELDFILSFTIS